MIPLFAQGPDERYIPDIVSIMTMDGLNNERIGISFPLIHPTTASARTGAHFSIAYNRGACILPDRPLLS